MVTTMPFRSLPDAKQHHHSWSAQARSHSARPAGMHIIFTVMRPLEGNGVPSRTCEGAQAQQCFKTTGREQDLARC